MMIMTKLPLLSSQQHNRLVALCCAFFALPRHCSVLASPNAQVFKVIQVHVVHRHGDRTPITPLKDKDFWTSELVQEALLEKVGQITSIHRNDNDDDDDATLKTHAASGRGPFGKLTQLGLLQMVQLGTELRAQLESTTEEAGIEDEDGHLHFDKLFYPHNPLEPNKLKVYSTDFPRTIQSVQGTLVGLFPDEEDGAPIQVDARHTNIMIPDPQPRLSKEQVKLEQMLVRRPHVLERDAALKDTARHMTQALAHLLHPEAFGVTYGVGEEGSSSSVVLSWAQLSEITKCLSVRDLLPESISEEMMHIVSSHTAWRWMETLRHPRMAFLSMNRMLSELILAEMQQKTSAPSLYLYSAHDSTLIGLLCALRLEQPAQWPEYASCFKMELLQVTSRDNKENNSDEPQYWVRCSLNNERLKCQWEDEHDGEPMDMIPLDQLVHLVATKGAMTE